MLVGNLTTCFGVVLAGDKARTEKRQGFCLRALVSSSLHKPRCVSEEVVFLQRLLYASRVFSLLVLGAPGHFRAVGFWRAEPAGA